MPPKDQIFMGAAIALLCLVGLVRQRWLLDETSKGQRFVRRFGRDGAVWVLCGLLVCGAILGGLLAAGVINPIRWD
jgi:hypothetical protein